MKYSAGLVVFRRKAGKLEILVAHMGAPWWAKKDIGAWTIPKGLVEDGEDPFEAAQREFQEELGLPVPEGEFMELGSIKQPNSKTVTAWAIEADIDVSNVKSITFEAEWPPRSGKKQEFPEIDRAAWLEAGEAAQKVVRGQDGLFQKLAEILKIELQEPKDAPQQGQLF
jgi:predicted NUDIX family NTP pyrophosphohydrolase